jgi:hypothetical protein
MASEERTTRELILKLGADVDRCHEALLAAIDAGERDKDGNVSADYEFHARQVIRAIFAYIEGVTFSLKITAAHHGLRKGVDMSPAERFFAAEVAYYLNDKGEVVERPAQIRLAENLRFAFSLYEKAHSHAPQFDPSSEWWACLRESIKVRDRLMHPRMPADLDVSGDEIVKALKAVRGFETLLHKYIHLDRRLTLRSKPTRTRAARAIHRKR